MSVHPIAYAPDGGITVEHDGHTGAVAFADVRFGRTPEGAVEVDLIEITCPVCGAVSVHPVSGGSHPGPVQKLFLRTVSRRAAALGIPAGQRSLAALKVRLKNRIAALDPDARFRLARMTSEDDDVDP